MVRRRALYLTEKRGAAGAIAGWRDAGSAGQALKARTATSAKVPLGAMATPYG